MLFIYVYSFEASRWLEANQISLNCPARFGEVDRLKIKKNTVKL